MKNIASTTLKAFQAGVIMDKQKKQTKVLEDLKISAVEKQKIAYYYLVISIAITLVLGTISLSNLFAYLPGFLIIAFQNIAFFGCGLLHVSYLKKNTSFPDVKPPFNNQLIFTFFLALVINIVLILLYLFTNSNMIRMSFAGSCAFLLPFVIQQAWKTYNHFIPKQYKVWYNSDIVMDSRTTVFLNSLPIRLRLSLKYFDITDEEFELTVPGHTQFGKFFNQFIIEKNKNNVPAIECIDNEKKPFGWQFYIERLGGLHKQYIDPELSLRENKVKDHSIITAKRQRTVETLTEKSPSTERKTLPPQLNRTKSINKHEAGK